MLLFVTRKAGINEVIRILFRFLAESRIYLFHNAVDHNDSSALPGHFKRAIPTQIMYFRNVLCNSKRFVCSKLANYGVYNDEPVVGNLQRYFVIKHFMTIHL